MAHQDVNTRLGKMQTLSRGSGSTKSLPVVGRVDLKVERRHLRRDEELLAGTVCLRVTQQKTHK